MDIPPVRKYIVRTQPVRATERFDGRGWENMYVVEHQWDFQRLDLYLRSMSITQWTRWT